MRPRANRGKRRLRSTKGESNEKNEQNYRHRTIRFCWPQIGVAVECRWPNGERRTVRRATVSHWGRKTVRAILPYDKCSATRVTLRCTQTVRTRGGSWWRWPAATWHRPHNVRSVRMRPLQADSGFVRRKNVFAECEYNKSKCRRRVRTGSVTIEFGNQKWIWKKVNGKCNWMDEKP